MDPKIQQALVGLVAAVITVLGVLIEVYGVKYVKAKFTAEQLASIQKIAEVGVKAVEQLAASGQIDYKTKYEEALKRVKDMAASRGFALTDEQWESVIESAVAAMRSVGGELFPKEPPAGGSLPPAS